MTGCNMDKKSLTRLPPVIDTKITNITTNRSFPTPVSDVCNRGSNRESSFAFGETDGRKEKTEDSGSPIKDVGDDRRRSLIRKWLSNIPFSSLVVQATAWKDHQEKKAR